MSPYLAAALAAQDRVDGSVSRGGRRGQRRARTVSIRVLARSSLPDPEAPTPGELAALELCRPTTRGQCAEGIRPCPFVGCRFHLAVDVSRAGGLTFQFGTDDLAQLEDRATCALDVADRGGLTLEAVAAVLGVTRERIRQLEERGLERLRRAARRGDLQEREESPTT